jgi:RNA polymerase sigma-70 factor (ECF subfamily)
MFSLALVLAPAPPRRDRTAAVADRAAQRSDAGTSPLDAAMERYSRGDDTAFEELYDGLAPRLLAYLMRQTRDHARAEDCVQQTMLQIHRARGRFMAGAQVLPWAFAIARRLLIDMHRRSGREVVAKDDDESALQLLVALDAPADDVAIAKELAARIAKVLATLPENQRVAFELIKQEGLSVAEAADVLGTTVAAVKLRAHRAYEALRDALGDLGGKAK